VTCKHRKKELPYNRAYASTADWHAMLKTACNWRYFYPGRTHWSLGWRASTEMEREANVGPQQLPAPPRAEDS